MGVFFVHFKTSAISVFEYVDKKIKGIIDTLYCDSDRIQTCNRLIRSQVLYSVELRSHSLLAFAKIRHF